MNIKYELGRFLNGRGYKMVRDYRWPEIYGNLLFLGFALLRKKEGHKTQILQIGAFDGHMCDPLEAILQNDRVHAILVEPQKIPYESLSRLYHNNPRIHIVNAAIGEFDGEAVLYVPAADPSPKASLIPHHHMRFGLKRSAVRKITVPLISVTTLLKQNDLKGIDILQLDTEGMDYRIMQCFFSAGIEPTIINFESLHLDKKERLASRDLLKKKGYWYIDTNEDTFAVKESLVRAINH
jgi:FkbM family methyltransferase